MTIVLTISGCRGCHSRRRECDAGSVDSGHAGGSEGRGGAQACRKRARRGVGGGGGGGRAAAPQPQRCRRRPANGRRGDHRAARQDDKKQQGIGASHIGIGRNVEGNGGGRAGHRVCHEGPPTGPTARSYPYRMPRRTLGIHTVKGIFIWDGLS